MLFRPPLPIRMWDTWLFPWEGRYHLYYLTTHTKPPWDGLGHAVSDDLLHWEILEPIRTRGPAGAWNDSPTFTGMTFAHRGRFYMLAGANPGGTQVVGLYESKDLSNWAEQAGNPVMRPMGPWYRTIPFAPISATDVDFRDPCVIWDEADQSFHAFVCARSGDPGPDATGACVAHYRSPDLIRWEALPPLAEVGGRFFHTEVPDVFQLDGTWYLLFTTYSFCMRIDTPSKEAVCGSFYMIGGARYTDPYRLPEDPLVIGSGGFSGYRLDAMVARTIPWEGGRLLYHHVASERPSLGAFKRIRRNPDGTLRIEYLPLLEKLETRTVLDGCGGMGLESAVSNLGQWRADGGGVSGRCAAGASRLTVAAGVPDLHLVVDIEAATAERAGVCFRISEREMALLFLDYARQELYVGAGKLTAPWALELFPAQDRYRMPLRRGQVYRLRVLVRDAHVEAYLDELWVFSYVLGGDYRSDGVGLLVHRGEARFSGLRVAAIEPLA